MHTQHDRSTKIEAILIAVHDQSSGQIPVVDRPLDGRSSDSLRTQHLLMTSTMGPTQAAEMATGYCGGGGSGATQSGDIRWLSVSIDVWAVGVNVAALVQALVCKLQMLSLRQIFRCAELYKTRRPLAAKIVSPHDNCTTEPAEQVGRHRTFGSYVM